MLFDDPHDSRQTESGALPNLFGRKERFKNPFRRRGIHSDTRIAHRKLDVSPWQSVSMSFAIVRIQVNVARLNEELASLGHRVPSVEAKIHQHLLDLRWVASSNPKIGREHHLD